MSELSTFSKLSVIFFIYGISTLTGLGTSILLYWIEYSIFTALMFGYFASAGTAAATALMAYASVFDVENDSEE